VHAAETTEAVRASRALLYMYPQSVLFYSFSLACRRTRSGTLLVFEEETRVIVQRAKTERGAGRGESKRTRKEIELDDDDPAEMFGLASLLAAGSAWRSHVTQSSN